MSLGSVHLYSWTTPIDCWDARYVASSCVLKFTHGEIKQSYEHYDYKPNEIHICSFEFYLLSIKYKGIRTQFQIQFLILIHCLFVCLWFIVPLENFSLIWRRPHYRWRAANFDLCSALMAIEQWGFFSVPHLWHGPSVYNGHLRGPATSHLLPSFWQWSCLYLFYDLGLSRLGFEHPTFCLQGQHYNPLRSNSLNLIENIYDSFVKD